MHFDFSFLNFPPSGDVFACSSVHYLCKVTFCMSRARAPGRRRGRPAPAHAPVLRRRDNSPKLGTITFSLIAKTIVNIISTRVRIKCKILTTNVIRIDIMVTRCVGRLIDELTSCCSAGPAWTRRDEGESTPPLLHRYFTRRQYFLFSTC